MTSKNLKKIQSNDNGLNISWNFNGIERDTITNEFVVLRSFEKGW